MSLLPWVGPRYKSEGLDGIRLLVLGEALYDPHVSKPARPRPSDANATSECVIELAINGPVKHRPFWTKVTKLILNRPNGEPVLPAERADLWNRLAFHNYIQWFMPAGRSKPTSAMWKEAREGFLQLEQKLAPDLILVLGRRLEANLPNVNCGLITINHPASVGFTYNVWCEKINTAFQRAKRR